METNYKLLNKDYERARVESIEREQQKEQELIKVSKRLSILLFSGG